MTSLSGASARASCHWGCAVSAAVPGLLAARDAGVALAAVGVALRMEAARRAGAFGFSTTKARAPRTSTAAARASQRVGLALRAGAAAVAGPEAVAGEVEAARLEA